MDLLIAAPAKVHRLMVATLNPRNFEPIVWDPTSGWLVCHPQGIHERHWDSSILGRPGNLARFKALVPGGVARAGLLVASDGSQRRNAEGVNKRTLLVRQLGE